MSFICVFSRTALIFSSYVSKSLIYPHCAKHIYLTELNCLLAWITKTRQMDPEDPAHETWRSLLAYKAKALS